LKSGKNRNQFTLSDIGFATFFLNRTNRSGILEGGIIGGKNQDGPFKLDARFKKTDLIERINLIAQYRGRIKLYNEDALNLVRKLIKSFSSKCLIYFDPPYFQKGKMLYKNFYTPKDHSSISRFVRKLRMPWIVTYDNVPEIKDLYEGEQQTEFDISYSAHLDRPRGKEIMFYKNLCLPVMPYTRKVVNL